MGFFSNRRNKIINEQIENILYTSTEYEDTNIHWEAFARFAEDHGGRIDKYADGGQDTSFEMILPMLYKVKVMAVRDRLDGTTSIKVEELFKVESYLKGVVRLGDRETTVNQPLKTFNDYLLKHGTDVNFEESTSEGLLNIDNKMLRIKFTKYSTFNKTNYSETKITILKRQK